MVPSYQMVFGGILQISQQPFIMQASWVIGLIAFCDKFEYKVVHISCCLFWECFRKTSKEKEILAPCYKKPLAQK